jgi:glycosyltransferase involved in cell wall biosynthesis
VDLYDSICEVLRPTDYSNTCTRYLTNSQWTATIATDAFGEQVTVVYPPVTTTDLEPEPWNLRRERLVSVGRISPDKNLLRNIEIVRNLHERGYEIQYDIVGPASRRSINDPYLTELQRTVSKYDYVRYRGELSREALVSLLGTSKYGLHGKDHEHFGIAVAEFVAAGMIPFVPDSGGQREIVGGNTDVMYGSIEEAVDRIASVLDDTSKQRELRDRLPDVETRFSSERFQMEFKQIVSDTLSSTDQGVSD